MLFRSPIDDESIPLTEVNKATELHSYVIEAQGKCYSRTREHLRAIHIKLPSPVTHKPQLPKPKVPPTHIPKPNLHLKHASQPKKLSPAPTSHTPSHIPRSTQLPRPTLPLMLPLQLKNYFDIYPPLTLPHC